MLDVLSINFCDIVILEAGWTHKSNWGKNMGETYFQKCGLICFDMSSAGGHMGATHFQEAGPRFFDMSIVHN